jgi:hypothetical protein
MFPGEEAEVDAEVGRVLAVPGGFVIGALGEGDAGAHHVELILESEIHIGRPIKLEGGCLG